MKVFLLIMLLDGNFVRIPMQDVEACSETERLIVQEEVSWTACEWIFPND